MKNRILSTTLLLCYTSILSIVSAGSSYGKPSDYGGKRSGGLGGFIFAILVIMGVIGIISEIGKRNRGN